MLLEGPRVLYENEVKRKHLICDCCGQAIYYGNYEYEQDDCYQKEVITYVKDTQAYLYIFQNLQ